MLLFSLVFLLTVAVISKNQFKIWLPINFGIVCAILVVEYFNPHFARNVYVNELSKSIDFGITYLVTITLTYFTISYIRKNYDVEHSSVLDKNMAIEGQRQELERLIAEKDKLFSIVTHDVRTPLNSIQGYLEVLADADLEEEELSMLKQQLLQITRDTSAMLTNVLSWSKTQMEGTRADLKPLNVKDALNKGLTIETNIAARKGVLFNIESEEQLVIIADPNMFQLVVRNLVNNAIKFTPKSGSVTIKAIRELGRCVIVVEDTGLGLNSTQQQHLFKLNASSTYGTNNERGIGLGLLLCKEFTELQGGEIWFESNAGNGSSFYVAFSLINE
ncbi:MAG: HAMP domain-containing histidine kinase [Pedobacter sp.]|nr:MAG: HAMP domain-containing histidine kinase [Pedobacter sp.]